MGASTNALASKYVNVAPCPTRAGYAPTSLEGSASPPSSTPAPSPSPKPALYLTPSLVTNTVTWWPPCARSSSVTPSQGGVTHRILLYDSHTAGTAFLFAASGPAFSPTTPSDVSASSITRTTPPIARNAPQA